MSSAVHVLVGVDVMALYGHGVARYEFVGSGNMALFRWHGQRIVHAVCFHVVCGRAYRTHLGKVHERPGCFRAGDQRAIGIAQVEISCGGHGLESACERADRHAFAYRGVAVDHKLPMREHPRLMFALQARRAVSYRFRMENAAVLEQVDERRQCHAAAMADLAVADSGAEFIYGVIFLHACSLPRFPSLPEHSTKRREAA